MCYTFLLALQVDSADTMTDFYEESCYLSNGEAEADSETEDFAPIEAPKSGELAWDDPQALLNTWLGELDSLKMVSVHTSQQPHSIIHACGPGSFCCAARLGVSRE